jgi:hypothetical protein
MKIRTPFFEGSLHAIVANSAGSAARARVITRAFPRCATGFLAIAIFLAIVPVHSNASAVDDEKTVAALDTEYQAAVEKMTPPGWIGS